MKFAWAKQEKPSLVTKCCQTDECLQQKGPFMPMLGEAVLHGIPGNATRNAAHLLDQQHREVVSNAVVHSVRSQVTPQQSSLLDPVTNAGTTTGTAGLDILSMSHSAISLLLELANRLA